MKKLIAGSVLFAVALAGVVNAQQGMVRIIAPNGMPVTVPMQVTANLGDIARGGNGRVMVSPQLLLMPWEFQQAVFAHEAAHAIGIMNETEADYFAGQMLRLAGFGPQQMQVVYGSMLSFLGPWGDATHLSSEARVRVVRAGYTAP